MPVVVEDVRRLAATLPRAYEVVVRDRIKFRVKSLVFVAFSRDESLMGFGFPKEEREFLVESRPDTFQLPSPATTSIRRRPFWSAEPVKPYPASSV